MPPGGFNVNRLKPMLFQHSDRPFGAFQDKVIFSRAEPDQLETLLQFRIVEHFTVALLEGRTGWRRIGSTTAKITEEARAEHARVRELIEMRYCNVQSLAPAHRKSRDGAMRAVLVHTVVLFDIGHDVCREILDKLIRRRPCSSSSSRSKREGARMSCGHHDHHRFRAMRGQQVVEDEAGAADRGPGIV